MKPSSPNLKTFLYFWRELVLPENQTKKSTLKKVLASYDVFTIFKAVKDREIPCEAN